MAQSVTIRCTATDPDGLTGFADKTFMLTGPTPPSTDLPDIVSITAGVNPIVPGDDTVITVVGRNYDRVIWSGFGLSAATSPETRTFTAPENVSVGTDYVVRVTLSNDFGSDTDTITMTISNVAPVINSLTGIPISIRVRDSFEAFANATDANGDDLIYSWRVTDTQGNTDPSVTQGIAEGNPPNGRAFQMPNSITDADDAVKTITCTVEDIVPPPNTSEDDSDSQDVIVEPNSPNAPNITSLDAERTQITVNWDPPTDNGGGFITGYRVWFREFELQTWNISRSILVSANINQYILASPQFSLGAGTDYEVGVQAFNTFDINGVSYGGISERGTDTITTDPLYIQPIDPTPEENSLPEVRINFTGFTLEVRKTDEVHVERLSGVYSDPDGDPLTVSWRALDFGLTGVSVYFEPIGNPFQGTTEVLLTFGADAQAGSLLLYLEAYDGISNDDTNPVSDRIQVTLEVS